MTPLINQYPQLKDIYSFSQHNSVEELTKIFSNIKRDITIIKKLEKI